MLIINDKCKCLMVVFLFDGDSWVLNVSIGVWWWMMTTDRKWLFWCLVVNFVFDCEHLCLMVNTDD